MPVTELYSSHLKAEAKDCKVKASLCNLVSPCHTFKSFQYISFVMSTKFIDIYNIYLWWK